VKNFIVTDLDGTLFDSSKRHHLALARDWDAFHSRISEDTVHEDVRQFIMAVDRAGLNVIAVTGRPETYRSETVDWLVKHRIPLEVILYRGANDFRPDKIVKQEAVEEFFGSLENALDRVLLILEDRDRMVEHWRSLGFRCWQVQPGGY
jgi:hydroxymethylpyrimidine pyrophosphatase-like HAD family hydrolase